LTRQILDLIHRENLKSGDRLPSVRSLAGRFSVAPNTMREALRRLQTSGVVELRHGSGVYVRDSQGRVVLANPNLGELEADTILQLLEARLLIEPHLAGLTAENADEAQISGLARCLDEAEEYLDGNDDYELQCVNMRFHRAIAEFSGNSILSQTVESFIDLYSFEQLVILAIYDDRSRDHREHQDILEAIRRKDAGLARETMQRHLQDVKSIIEAKLAEGELD
jgi:GntR family transcriptional repressor for pyruvate dehydrogenase complex